METNFLTYRQPAISFCFYDLKRAERCHKLIKFQNCCTLSEFSDAAVEDYFSMDKSTVFGRLLHCVWLPLPICVYLRASQRPADIAVMNCLESFCKELLAYEKVKGKHISFMELQ